MTAADANEYFLWAVMAGAAFSVGLGLVRLHAWSERRHFAALRAECQAVSLVSDAQRMRDWIRWEDDTLCGTFPDRASRDAALARAQSRQPAAGAVL